jgi:hypothetical protein
METNIAFYASEIILLFCSLQSFAILSAEYGSANAKHERITILIHFRPGQCGIRPVFTKRLECAHKGKIKSVVKLPDKCIY